MRKLLAALLLVSAPAQAARPMYTDDARVVDPKACQVETWVRRNVDSTEAWALPACNPTGDFELTFGGARVWEHGENTFAQQLLQAKTILRPLEPDGWGLALAVGTTRSLHRERANGWPGDAYFYVPLSVSFANDAWVVHVNAGAVHRRDDRRNVGTWGLGNEVRLRDDLFFIPEIYQNDRGRPFYQAGFRYWIVKDRLQVDATYGNRAVSETGERWFSIGLRVLSPPFLP